MRLLEVKKDGFEWMSCTRFNIYLHSFLKKKKNEKKKHGSMVREKVLLISGLMRIFMGCHSREHIKRHSHH